MQNCVNAAWLKPFYQEILYFINIDAEWTKQINVYIFSLWKEEEEEEENIESEVEKNIFNISVCFHQCGILAENPRSSPIKQSSETATGDMGRADH